MVGAGDGLEQREFDRVHLMLDRFFPMLDRFPVMLVRFHSILDRSTYFGSLFLMLDRFPVLQELGVDAIFTDEPMKMLSALGKV